MSTGARAGQGPVCDVRSKLMSSLVMLMLKLFRTLKPPRSASEVNS